VAARAGRAAAVRRRAQPGLWRAVGARQLLANAADAAAIAGSTGIDDVRFRATGEVVLDPEVAGQRVRDSLAPSGRRAHR
jgi:hypothetical protein